MLISLLSFFDLWPVSGFKFLQFLCNSSVSLSAAALICPAEKSLTAGIKLTFDPPPHEHTVPCPPSPGDLWPLWHIHKWDVWTVFVPSSAWAVRCVFLCPGRAALIGRFFHLPWQVLRGSRRNRTRPGGELLVSGAGGLGDVRSERHLTRAGGT